MVKRILSPRKTVTEREKRIEFDLRDGDGGATFAAGDDWSVRFDPEWEDCQKATWEECLTRPEKYAGPFRRIIERTAVKNATAVCECGNKIELRDQYLGASACPFCGTWHNLFGQTLLEPEYWEGEN